MLRRYLVAVSGWALCACYPAEVEVPPLPLPAGTRAVVLVEATRLSTGTESPLGVGRAVAIDAETGDGQDDAAYLYYREDAVPVVAFGALPEPLTQLGLTVGRLPVGPDRLPAAMTYGSWALGDDTWAVGSEDAGRIYGLARVRRAP